MGNLTVDEMIGIDEAVRRAIDTKSQIYNRKSSCPDDQRDAELRNLYHLAEIAPNGASAEIGVRTGGSLLCWSCAREGRGPIYAIDNWSSKTEKLFRTNVERYGVPVEIITAESWDAPKLIPDLLAFVFIDGNHDTGIWKDIPAWTPKIMPNGIIAYHDYGVWKPTVHIKAAVDRWQAEAQWAIVGKVGSTLAFRRPR